MENVIENEVDENQEYLENIFENLGFEK